MVREQRGPIYGVLIEVKEHFRESSANKEEMFVGLTKEKFSDEDLFSRKDSFSYGA